MDHDSAGVAWEVASRNFNYWRTVEVAYEATTEELIVVAGSFNSSGNLLLDSVVESWRYKEYAACDRSFSFVEVCAQFKNVAVSIVSGWAVVLGSCCCADSCLREAVSVDHWDNLFFHLCAHDFACLLCKCALLVVAAVNNDLKALVVAELVGSYDILKFVVATKAVAGVGAAVVGWLNGGNGVNIDCFPILLITMLP